MSSSTASISRVKAHVRFITWVPSEAGRINTTDKTSMIVAVWVNHPLDDRFKIDDRGGEQAIRVVRTKMAADGIEWLGLIAVQVDVEDREDSIINQPKRGAAADLGIEAGEPPVVSKLVLA